MVVVCRRKSTPWLVAECAPDASHQVVSSPAVRCSTAKNRPSRIFYFSIQGPRCKFVDLFAISFSFEIHIVIVSPLLNESF
jgi:hypothetical protein